MSTIRSLVIAAFVVALMFNVMLMALGGFAFDNNVALPSAISAQYNAISGNRTSNSVLGGIGNLSTKVNNAQNLTTNSSFISGSITVVSIVTNIFGAVDTAYTVYVGFIGAGLSVINPTWTTYASGIAILLVIVLIVLSIMSAIMLFPI